MSKINYTRRDFLKTLGFGATAISTSSLLSSCQCGNKTQSKTCRLDTGKKRHLITLSFDDGFKKSSIRTAEIYEKYNLSACINIVATAHEKSFKLPNIYHDHPVGDFVLWNELQDRGHEIMPHSYKHANKANLPFHEAQGLILRCLDYFYDELDGFDAKKAVFNFPHNASTPELEQWLATQVMAFRTGGGGINPLPHNGQVKLTCSGYGPGNSEEHLDNEIKKLLATDSGWLVYNTHGLDDEGWGPIGADYLDRLLDRMVAIESVKVIPAGKALLEV